MGMRIRFEFERHCDFDPLDFESWLQLSLASMKQSLGPIRITRVTVPRGVLNKLDDRRYFPMRRLHARCEFHTAEDRVEIVESEEMNT